MQVNYIVTDRKIHKLNRIIVYGNPYLFGLLKGSIHLYIDATFYCCPKGYEQMLIVMVFDEWTKTYVDMLYILISVKSIFIFYSIWPLIFRHHAGRT